MIRKNLAVVITDYGSLLNFLFEFVNEISTFEQYKVFVFSSSNNLIRVNDRQLLTNVTFIEVDFPREFNFAKIIFSALEVRRLVRRYDIALVHAHFSSAIFASVLFKVRKTYYWGTYHGLNFNAVSGIEKYIFSVVEVFSCMRLDRIFVLNQYDYNCLRSLKFKKVFKTSSYGVGCKLDCFPTAHSPFFTNKRKEVVICFTGRFVSFKGFPMLISAFKRLDQISEKDLTLKLIGDFDPFRSSGLCKGSLEYVKQSRNIVITGFIDNVGVELEDCDIFLFLSRKEGLPISLLEALVSGKLVVALNSRGVEEVIQDSVNGFLVEDHSDDEIVIDRIVNLLRDILDNFNDYGSFISATESKRSDYSRRAYVVEQRRILDEFLLD